MTTLASGIYELLETKIPKPCNNCNYLLYGLDTTNNKPIAACNKHKMTIRACIQTLSKMTFKKTSCKLLKRIGVKA